ncbi:MAG: hypothetical protein HFE63_10235 [Clostridiales bacterium]|nr:hypothetical protein [Clostridiales bacterium]
MKKIDPAVKRETIYVTSCVVILSLIMQAVFLIIGKWDYTVLLGNLLSGGVAVLNFFLMGLTVQSAVELEEKEARNRMKTSMSLRMVLLVITAALGVGLPCFSIITSLVPLFFVRIAVAVRPLFNKYIEADGGK